MKGAVDPRKRKIDVSMATVKVTAVRDKIKFKNTLDPWLASSDIVIDLYKIQYFQH